MKSSLDTAIENVISLFDKNVNKIELSARIYKLAATFDPEFKIPNQENSDVSIFCGNDQKAQAENERRRVEMRLNDFDYKNSDAWQIICERFGPGLTHNELLSIAQIIAFHARIRLDREAKRRKEVLIKWFQENIVTIIPFLQKMVLEDSEGNRIG